MMTLQNPRLGSWTHAAATTTMCPAPSSTRGRSSSCPTLRTRASGCGTCRREPVCRPFAGTMIASGCWGLTQTSTCLLLVCEHQTTLAAYCTGRHHTHCNFNTECETHPIDVPFLLIKHSYLAHFNHFFKVPLLLRCDTVME